MLQLSDRKDNLSGDLLILIFCILVVLTVAIIITILPGILDSIQNIVLPSDWCGCGAMP